MSNTILAIIGISFIFIMTSLGGLIVFFFKKPLSGKMNNLFIGVASGLMVAASVWSLLIPAIEQSKCYDKLSFLPATIGIVIGALFLVVIDKLLSKFQNRNNYGRKGLSKAGKLCLAVTIHNIPEGLAVGLAFGNAFIVGAQSVFMSALWLAIGIGLQNMPEGSAVVMPMKEHLGSNKKAFLYCLLSGIVEPVMAVLGLFLSGFLTPVMPYLLSFSAGTMLFVVAQELMPQMKDDSPSLIAGWGFIAGFIVMMILDVALG